MSEERHRGAVLCREDHEAVPACRELFLDTKCFFRAVFSGIFTSGFKVLPTVYDAC